MPQKLLFLFLLALIRAAAGCNVCAACFDAPEGLLCDMCEEALPEGLLCDMCEEALCLKKPLPPGEDGTRNSTRNSTPRSNSSAGGGQCNVCEPCCSTAISDGSECDSCVYTQCDPIREWMKFGYSDADGNVATIPGVEISVEDIANYAWEGNTAMP